MTDNPTIIQTWLEDNDEGTETHEKTEHEPTVCLACDDYSFVNCDRCEKGVAK